MKRVKGEKKLVTSSYVEEEYENGVQVYVAYIGVSDPVFLAVYQDKVWGSGEDPLGAVYDAAKKWDSRHYPHLRGNPFRQLLEPTPSGSAGGVVDYPTTRDDDSRHLDSHEKELYGD